MQTAVSAEAPRSRALLIAGWTGAFIAYRIGVVLLGFNGTFFWEEAYRVLAADVLLQGWPVPLVDLQADPYAGGSLVMAVLYAPLLWAFGPSIVALKLVGIAWTAAGLAIWLHTIAKYFGRAAANAFGLLFVLAPPAFVVFNVFVMGSHQETVTLSGLQFLMLYRFVYGERRSSELAAWCVTAGLSMWFCYTSVVTFVPCVLFALAAGALPPRRWAALAAFVAAGLSPWLAYNWAVSGAGVQVVGRTFLPIVHAGGGWLHWYLAAGSDLLKYGIPRALLFDDWAAPVLGGDIALPGVVCAYAVWGLFVACWALTSVRCLVGLVTRRAGAGVAGVAAGIERYPELALLSFFPLCVALLAASEHDFSAYPIVPFLPSRVLIPLLPVMFFTIALATTSVPRAWRRWGVIALCGYAICGLVSSRQVLTAGSMKLAAVQSRILPIGAEVFGHLLVTRRGNDVGTIAERIAAIDADLRPAAYRGVGFSLAFLYFYQPDRLAARLRSDMDRIDPQYRRDADTGLEKAFRGGLDQIAALPDTPRSRELAATMGLGGSGAPAQGLSP